MARINLLPWREEKRRERQRQFMTSLLLTAILGVVLVFFTGFIFDQKTAHQQSRNQMIEDEIKALEIRIARIDELERTRARLISRKQVIERLQASRSTTVELLDKLAKTIPVGVTLTTIRQQANDLSLIGTSQSNARVSAYLRELETNDLFLNPELGYVRSVNTTTAANATEPYTFSIKVTLRPPKSADDDEGYEDPDSQVGAE